MKENYYRILCEKNCFPESHRSQNTVTSHAHYSCCERLNLHKSELGGWPKQVGKEIEGEKAYTV